MPDSPLGRELRRRLWRLVIPSYVLVVFVAAGAVWLNDRESDARQAQDHAAEIARAVDACQARNGFREALKELIGVATAPSGAEAVDLTSPESFAYLDAAQQAYLIELQADLVAQGGPGSEHLAEFAESLEPEDCSMIVKDG